MVHNRVLPAKRSGSGRMRLVYWRIRPLHSETCTCSLVQLCNTSNRTSCNSNQTILFFGQVFLKFFLLRKFSQEEYFKNTSDLIFKRKIIFFKKRSLNLLFFHFINRGFSSLVFNIFCHSCSYVIIWQILPNKF